MNIYFDNNFFNKKIVTFIKVRENKEMFLRPFRDKQWTWCFSEELLRELFSIANSKRTFLLQDLALLCSEMLPYSYVLRNYAKILEDELSERTRIVFEPMTTLEKINPWLKSVADGQIPYQWQDLLLDSNERKNEDRAFLKGIHNIYKNVGKTLPFYAFAIHFLETNIKRHGAKDPHKKAQYVFDNIDNYPHTRAFLLTSYDYSYNKKSNKNMPDLRHIVHSVDMDWFITDDKDMSRLMKWIFSNTPQIIKQKDFLEKVRVKSSK